VGFPPKTSFKIKPVVFFKNHIIFKKEKIIWQIVLHLQQIFYSQN